MKRMMFILCFFVTFACSDPPYQGDSSKFCVTSDASNANNADASICIQQASDMKVQTDRGDALAGSSDCPECEVPLCTEENSDDCVECYRNDDCPDPVREEISECTYPSICATEGSHMMVNTSYVCVNQQCVAQTQTEIEVCGRYTENQVCGEVSTTEWSECQVANDCDVTGFASRKVFSPKCVAEQCTSIETEEIRNCNANTSGVVCIDSEVSMWSECVYPNACSLTGTRVRTVTNGVCNDGQCTSVDTEENQVCTRDTNGQECTSCPDNRSCICQEGLCQDIYANEPCTDEEHWSCNEENDDDCIAVCGEYRIEFTWDNNQSICRDGNEQEQSCIEINENGCSACMQLVENRCCFQ